MSMTLAGGPAGNRARAEINMTPLIDVLLVLLIIFMLVTPIKSRGLNTAVPQPATSSAAAPLAPVVISIDAEARIAINSQPVTLDTLTARLNDIFRHRNDRTVFVSGAPSLEFRQVAQVFDLAKGAGVDRVAVLTGTGPGTVSQ